MRVYLDVSCLNRPFDDQTQSRIRLESEAVLIILEQAEAGRWTHIASENSLIEIIDTPDIERRMRLRALLPEEKDIVKISPAITARAKTIVAKGPLPGDALHLAAAEAGNADVFLTCDDRLLKQAKRLRKQLRVRVANPIDWLKEQNNADDS